MKKRIFHLITNNFILSIYLFILSNELFACENQSKKIVLSVIVFLIPLIQMAYTWYMCRKPEEN